MFIHTTPPVSERHYISEEYDTKERFISYWQQIEELRNFKEKIILEIGIGNGTVARYLQSRGFRVYTLDIDKQLKPDVVGSVFHIPFRDGVFDVIGCFEVLEHLPYSGLARALGEMYRVARKYAILSLPDSTRVYRLDVQIPTYGFYKALIPMPRLRNPLHSFDGQHYWEIGKSGSSLRDVVEKIGTAGFCIEETYRIFEVPYHRFFRLLKVTRRNGGNKLSSIAKQDS